MYFKKEELIKSPMNYTGGKFKLLPQILPLFPDNVDTFVDLFAGGCDVGINVKANKVICNDIEKHVINLMRYFQSTTYDNIILDIENIILKYKLSESNKNGYEYYNCNSEKGLGMYNKDKYIKLREDYNKNKTSPIMFYTVLIFSFNNMIRFNSKGEFNIGVNKRDFNNNLRRKLKKYINLKKQHIKFINKSFEDLKIDKLNKNDFVYADPPYLITVASYNENGGWNEEMEYKLLSKLDDINNQGIKFALSNVLEHKGKSNDILKQWAKRYNIHYLNHSYGNCNYQTKDKSKNGSIEVLITNY